MHNTLECPQSPQSPQSLFEVLVRFGPGLSSDILLDRVLRASVARQGYAICSRNSFSSGWLCAPGGSDDG